MRRFLRYICGLSIALAAQAQAEPITFSIAAPNARQVFVAGEMTAWDAGKRAMQRDPTGVWRVTLDMEPGEYLYKFVVDGQWLQDPATADHDSDGRGGQHSYVFVGDGPWTVPPGAPRGEVRVHQVESKELGQSMAVNVYLPPSYRRGQELPVLWLLHGGGMDADQWFKTGHVERYLDHLLAAGTVHPFVVVMPSGGKKPYDGASDRFVSRELPEWLATTYGLHPRKARSALAGMSYGGYGTVALGVRHPGQYGFGYALSGWYPPELLKEVADAPLLAGKLVLRCGMQDDLLSGNRDLVRILEKRGASFDYKEDQGAHTFHLWSLQTKQMLVAVDAYFEQGDR
jgi:enterochelin esterase-like enzyme